MSYKEKYCESYKERYCENCGKLFRPVSPSQITCSKECKRQRKQSRDQARRKNNAAIIARAMLDLEWLNQMYEELKCRSSEISHNAGMEIIGCREKLGELQTVASKLSEAETKLSEAEKQIASLGEQLENAKDEIGNLRMFELKAEALQGELEDARAKITELERNILTSGKSIDVQEAKSASKKKSGKRRCANCGNVLNHGGYGEYCSEQCFNEHNMGRLD